MFEVYYDSVKNFKDRYFMVNPLSKVAYVSICDVQFDAPSKCYERFPKFWHQMHFLDRAKTYVHLPNDFFQ